MSASAQQSSNINDITENNVFTSEIQTVLHSETCKMNEDLLTAFQFLFSWTQTAAVVTHTAIFFKKK